MTNILLSAPKEKLLSPKAIIFFGILLFLITLSVAVQQDIVYGSVVVLFFLLTSFFVFQKKVNLFGPFELFTLYYYTIIPAVLYIYLTNFERIEFLNKNNLHSDWKSLLELSLVYYIIGYLFALIGYKTFERKGIPIIKFNDGISIRLVNWTIMLFAVIGLLNFSYNVVHFANGNPVIYFMNVSTRYLEFEEPGTTTLGYLFGEMAAYLWLYKMLKLQRINYLFFAYLALSIFMKATTGRISSTIFYSITFIFVYYVVNLKQSQTKNLKYLSMLIVFGFIGIIFYLFRITSSLAFNEQLQGNWFETAISFTNVDSLMYLAMGKGNLPNIPIFMQIIDSWGKDIGFLYGQSLISWTYSIVPSSIRPINYQVSVLVKNIWHAQDLGGNLPPTGVGEMYANFGVLGPVIGMYFFGCIVAFVKNLLFTFNNFWYLVIYSNISVGFIFIYAKGEFDNMSLWFILPTAVTYMLLKLLTNALTKNVTSNDWKNPGLI